MSGKRSATWVNLFYFLPGLLKPAYMQVLKDLTLGTDISRPYVTTLAFEGGELFSVVF